MHRHVSMTKLSAALVFSLAAQVCTALPVASIRNAGDSLDPSIQNEAGRAESQAALWLTARQQPDGSWGTSHRFRTTALALLALAANGRREQSDACSRAVLWLEANASNHISRGEIEPHAWYVIALTRLVADSPARTNLLARYARRAAPALNTATPDARRIWCEALALAGATNAPTAAPTPQTEFDRIAKAWPDSTRNAAEMWRIARLINARPDGQLVLGQTPLDWRRDLAQILITAQRSDPKGGGYWDAPTEDRRIEETAFALLTLLEL